MSDALSDTLGSFSRELESRNLQYALIGGLAASIRGRVRATEDIDLIVRCSLEAALELVRSLSQSSFQPLLENYEEVARSALVVPILNLENQIQLDLAVGLSGFEQEIVERADPIAIGHHEVFVATAEDLLVLKILAGRPQDLLDVQGIVEVQAEQLDWQYCIATAERLEEAVGRGLVQQIQQLRSK